VGNPEKAASIMGFRARTSLVNGLVHTVEWMKR
jgi:hypothetical protein